MKILCLHGLRHNKDLLQKSMKDMVKKIKDVEFVFVNSPFIFEDSNLDGMYCWWNATRENALTIDKYDMIEDSISYLLDVWNKDNFDGILGFSQGSVVVQIFCYYIQNQKIQTYSPKFAILCSTTEISDIKLSNLYETKLVLPICLMYGMKDGIIPKDTSLAIANKLSNEPYLVEHTGGHYVSSNRETISKLLIFLKKLT